MTVLEIEGLTAGYGGRQVVHGVSFRVAAGQWIAVIGPNGAGKSTCLRAIFGMIHAGGCVRLDGEDVTGAGPVALLGRGVAFVPQGRNVFPLMTVRENLMVGGEGRQSRRQLATRIAWALETFPDLGVRAGHLARTLSGGQARMLELARALIGTPRILLLDEPSMGLAPQMVQQVFGMLSEIHRTQGVAILMVEQNVYQAARRCDYMYVLEGGRNRFEGPPAHVMADEALRHTYLGRGVPTGILGSESVRGG